MKNSLVAGIVITAVILGSYTLWQKGPWTHNVSGSNSSTPTITDTIVFDGSSFTPFEMTVRAGTTVTVKNTSSRRLDFDSDPHPVHTDDTDLNVGQINPNNSKTFVAQKKGEFGYHDHADPSIHAKITVN